MKKLIIKSVLLSFISLNAYAVEKKICIVKSDMDQDYGTIVYDYDEGNDKINHLYMDQFKNGVFQKRLELSASELKSSIVLLQKDSKIVLRIQSDNFDLNSGGVLKLDTLYNAIKDSRKEYEFDLAKSNEGFKLFNKNVEFNEIKFIAKRSKVLGVIGIEKVVFSKN